MLAQQNYPRKGKAIIQNKHRITTMKGHQQIRQLNQCRPIRKHYIQSPTSPILWEFQPIDPNKKSGKFDSLDISDIEGTKASSLIHPFIRNKMMASKSIQNRYTNKLEDKIAYKDTTSLLAKHIFPQENKKVQTRNKYPLLQISNKNAINMRQGNFANQNFNEKGRYQNFDLDQTLNYESLYHQHLRQKIFNQSKHCEVYASSNKVKNCGSIYFGKHIKDVQLKKQSLAQAQLSYKNNLYNPSFISSLNY